MNDCNYRKLVASVPEHLQCFCVEQRYADYTAEHQFTWRYIIEHLERFMDDHAHPAMVEGFRRFAIRPDHITHIDELNAGLAQVGWRAVLVDGFLPPVIFMEFQAHQVLPISADMRSLDHIVYTPAPDIVHEAAGHAPMIADPDYRAFLKRVGECGARTLWNAEDDAVYQAIRALSIAKEHPNADAPEVAEAEQSLEAAVRSQQARAPSEATRLARLHWWTVEYGLIGSLTAPRIFGAGLASSLLESRHCVAPDTLRLPLSRACLDDDYDITDVQPHYYVAPDWQHLNDLLDEFETDCAFRIGGLEGVRRAIEHGTCATAEYASGLQVTGRFERALTDDDGALYYIGTGGPTELAFRGHGLAGHDGVSHPEGFGAPVGPLADVGLDLASATSEQLAARGIRCGQHVDLCFASGLRITGRVVGLDRRAEWNLLLHLDEARVTAPDGAVLYRPAWGRYHMAMGGPVVSVFGGPGDRSRLVMGEDPRVSGLESSMRDRPVRYSRTQLHAEALYRRLLDGADPAAIYRELCGLVGDKWLMLLKIYEQACSSGQDELARTVHAELVKLRELSDEKRLLIDQGLEGLAVCEHATA